MLTVRLGSLALIVTCAASAAAQETGFTTAYTDCMAASGGVTSIMRQCIGEEIERQEKRLNTAYQATLKALPAARQMALRDVQRKWIAYRDAACGFLADPAGGTVAPLQAADCRLQETARRAAEIEALKPE